ncbi:MAG: nucleotide exchange factor GrpE [Nitrospira sp.]|nr:nucleotide exchange factor GrpE [bacterium]MBL7049705.1 nucleotide exchange factor GrpE [Nitrospira sp.]
MSKENTEEQPLDEGSISENLEVDSAEDTDADQEIKDIQKATEEANNKYLRLYADFENYKKISARNREEVLKYANEGLLTDMLTVIDHLELALQHSDSTEAANSLAEGIDLTLKELRNVLEKHDLKMIEAEGKAFDPSVHHAIAQTETDTVEENIVIKEFRKGYIYKDRVIRASMVEVSKKPAGE